MRDLYLCIRVLGFKMGFRYWRIRQQAAGNPKLVVEWAKRCRIKAISAPEPLRSAYLSWAEELEKCRQDRMIA